MLKQREKIKGKNCMFMHDRNKRKIEYELQTKTQTIIKPGVHKSRGAGGHDIYAFCVGA